MQKNKLCPPLILKDLACHIDDVPLFKPISLNISPGQCLIISGENGIGKTTLLRSIQGLSKDFSGTINQPKSRLFIQAKRPFECERTVFQNLKFWQAYYELKKTSNIDTVLKDWDLINLKDVPFKKLSEGQKQRLNLARLSLTSFNFWLLDEPFSFLDSKAQKRLWSHIEKHLEKGGICCLVHHHFKMDTNISKKLEERMILQELSFPNILQQEVA